MAFHMLLVIILNDNPQLYTCIQINASISLFPRHNDLKLLLVAYALRVFQLLQNNGRCLVREEAEFN